MGRRKHKKKSKAQLRREKEQTEKLAAQAKEVEDRRRREAEERGENPDEVLKAVEEKKRKKAAIDVEQEGFVLPDNEDESIKSFTRDIRVTNILIAPLGGGTPLIQRSDLNLIHGHRYGLIGKNGAGKTTLLRHIAEKQFRNFPDYLRVHLVQQEMEGSELTVLETVMASDIELTALLKEKEKILHVLELPEKLEKRDRELYMEQLAAEEQTRRETEEQTVLEEENAEATPEQNVEAVPEHIPEAEPLIDEEPVVVEAPAMEPELPQEPQTETVEVVPEPVKIEIPMSEEHAKALEEAEKIPPMRLVEIDERLVYLEADQAEHRASNVLNGLNFTDRMKNLRTADLSGGWRMRVSLACGLFIEPDVLLLDEPTNHLDYPSCMWLTEYLTYYNSEKSLIIVSHDRHFLDEVTTDTIHLDRRRLTYYKGNFAQFVTTRTELRRHQATQYKKQQREIAHQEDFIRRFAANKKWSKQAESRRKLLAKMKRVEAVYSENNFTFRFPEPLPLRNKHFMDIENLAFGYFGEDESRKTYLLTDVDARIEMGTKVGVIGANGAGKSTLLKLIMKDLNPIEGKCFMRNEVQFGYFAQHHMETIDVDATPLQFLRHEYPNTSTQMCFQRLGRFNISAKHAQKPINTLSGGEKSRLAFCLLTWYSPHLVIMDEPTNHLDLTTQDALVSALQDYEGSLLIVSHDKHLLTSVCNEFWVVGNRTLTSFGNFDKATQFCYKRCAPVDVLPREFSTVEAKKVKKIPERAKKSRPDEILAGDGDTVAPAVIFEVNAEREIEKGIAKNLTPTQMIKHLKGWEPVDGQQSVINILVFHMFNKYFQDPNSQDLDLFEFLENYAPLMNVIVPPGHKQNQINILKIAQSCWYTSKMDNFEKAQDNDSLITTFECFFQFQYVTDEAFLDWRNLESDSTRGREEADKILIPWIDELGLEYAPAKEEEIDTPTETEI